MRKFLSQKKLGRYASNRRAVLWTQGDVESSYRWSNTIRRTIEQKVQIRK